jgi:hypothetical protein
MRGFFILVSIVISMLSLKMTNKELNILAEEAKKAGAARIAAIAALSLARTEIKETDKASSLAYKHTLVVCKGAKAILENALEALEVSDLSDALLEKQKAELWEDFEVAIQAAERAQKAAWVRERDAAASYKLAEQMLEKANEAKMLADEVFISACKIELFSCLY